MLAEKVRDLGLDRLGQQSTHPIAQDFGELIVDVSWLNQLDDVIVGHGISLLRWRSGGVKHPTICRLPDSRRHQLWAIARRQTANLHQLHAFGLLVKAPLCVTTPSSTVLCSAYMIGLTIYGIKRPCVGNLSSRPTILSLKPNCLRWRRSARRSPITSKII